MRYQVLVDRQAPVGRWVFVDYLEFLVCRTFVDGHHVLIVACLSLAIAFPAEFLRLHQLHLECESVVEGILAAEISSQDNIAIEASNFQL